MTGKHNKEIAETIKSALEFYKYELDLPLTNFIFQSPLHWNVMTIIALATNLLLKQEYREDLLKNLLSIMISELKV